jgi:hypothetical protein
MTHAAPKINHNWPTLKFNKRGTFDLKNLTVEDLRTVLYALSEHRKLYERDLNDTERNRNNVVEEAAFLHTEAGNVARLHYSLFLDHDPNTRASLMEILGTDLDI